MGAIEMLKNFHFTARNSEEAALQALTAGLDVEASSDCYPAIPGLIERGELNREIVDEAVRRYCMPNSGSVCLMIRMEKNLPKGYSLRESDSAIEKDSGRIDRLIEK
ncbi:hypothetical protein BFINE_18760 [Bacteroides finegoldii DSM 17565]|nr:hypothetical protein BFINE_18760 [Bacteroides finegoldii DSM 17565]